MRSGLTTADQEGFPRYLQAPHQSLRTQRASGLGQVHPPSLIREQHLVSDTKRAVTPWKWILLAERRCRRRAGPMSDEAMRPENTREAASPPGRGHAPGRPVHRASEQQAAILRLPSSTRSWTDSAADTTVGVGTAPEGTCVSSASFITTGAEDPEVTGGNKAGAASNAYPPNGAIESTGRRAFAVAGGGGVSAARTPVADIVHSAEDVV